MRLRALVSVAVAAVTMSTLLSGCGTVLIHNNFAATVSDPAGVLKGQPLKISIFDPLMGQSSDWAAKSMGTATSDQPYTTTVTTTATRLIGTDDTTMVLTTGIELPQLASGGFFSVQMAPKMSTTESLTANFIPYYSGAASPNSKATARPSSVPLDVTYQEVDNGWQYNVVINIPPTWAQAESSGPR